jgi:hypothetical protein
MTDMAKRNGMGSMLLMVGVGAGLMYLFDPEKGDQRRAQLRDKVTELQSRAGTMMDSSKIEELRTRASDIASQAGARLSEAADDLEGKASAVKKTRSASEG